MLEALVSAVGYEGIIALGTVFAHNVIPQKWQFWAKDDNNLVRRFKRLIVSIAEDIAEDGELDGDTVQ